MPASSGMPCSDGAVPSGEAPKSPAAGANGGSGPAATASAPCAAVSVSYYARDATQRARRGKKAGGEDGRLADMKLAVQKRCELARRAAAPCCADAGPRRRGPSRCAGEDLLNGSPASIVKVDGWIDAHGAHVNNIIETTCPEGLDFYLGQATEQARLHARGARAPAHSCDAFHPRCSAQTESQTA